MQDLSLRFQNDHFIVIMSEQRCINGVLTQDPGVADKKKLLARPGDGHIQLAIHRAVVVEVAEVLHLIRAVHTKGENNQVSLAALKPFHGVDHHLFSSGEAGSCETVPDKGNLIPVGGNDACMLWLKR